MSPEERADAARVLAEASERVQAVVEEVAAHGESTMVVGKGAAGDKTLLADSKAEGILIGALQSLRGMRILSEEAGWRGEGREGRTAVVDPLDGSDNFSRGIPFYCTSVAIAEGSRLSQVTLGLVRNLVTGDVYVAEAGKGATKNGAKIRSSAQTELSLAVAGVDLSGIDRPLAERVVPLASSLRRQMHLGANALEICLAAEGVLDAFLDLRRRIRVTDVAAACLIAKEAGAVVTDDLGEPLDPILSFDSKFAVVVSGNAGLHAKALALL